MKSPGFVDVVLAQGGDLRLANRSLFMSKNDTIPTRIHKPINVIKGFVQTDVEQMARVKPSAWETVSLKLSHECGWLALTDVPINISSSSRYH